MMSRAVSWAKTLSARFGRLNELRNLDPDEVSRIAGESGVSVPDLLKLARGNGRSQDLLNRRLVEMVLSEKVLRDRHPREFNDLNRVCAMCTSTRRCANDFRRQKPGRSEYCPNTYTLEVLRAAGYADAEPNVARISR